LTSFEAGQLSQMAQCRPCIEAAGSLLTLLGLRRSSSVARDEIRVDLMRLSRILMNVQTMCAKKSRLNFELETALSAHSQSMPNLPTQMALESRRKRTTP